MEGLALKPRRSFSLRAPPLPTLQSRLPLLLLPLSGCPSKKKDQGAGGGTAGTGTTSGTQQAALLPIGMADPFARLSPPVAKAMERGYKALKLKKYDEAAAAFGEVVAGAPDHTASRFQYARALLLSGKLPEARQQLEELLARDFIAYAGRVDKPKEWKPLRLGVIEMKAGQGTLALKAVRVPGKQVMDVRAVALTLLP